MPGSPESGRPLDRESIRRAFEGLEKKAESLEEGAGPDVQDEVDGPAAAVGAMVEEALAADGEHTLTMKCRSRNAFGGMVLGRVQATVDNETCEAILDFGSLSED